MSDPDGTREFWLAEDDSKLSEASAKLVRWLRQIRGSGGEIVPVGAVAARLLFLETRLLEAEQERSRLARELEASQGREAAVILLRNRWQRRRKAARELNRKERKGLSAQQRDRAIGRFFGYREVVTELDECIETLSPTAEAIRRVVEAAEKETEAELRTERASGSEFDHYYDKIEPARDRRRAAVATLQALRASRPGVEKDGK